MNMTTYREPSMGGKKHKTNKDKRSPSKKRTPANKDTRSPSKKRKTQKDTIKKAKHPTNVEYKPVLTAQDVMFRKDRKVY